MKKGKVVRSEIIKMTVVKLGKDSIYVRKKMLLLNRGKNDFI